MAEIVVATLNVNFSEDTESSKSGVLKLEIDGRENGLNGGDTSFQPGDTVGFWLFKDSNVTLETPVPISTSGGVTGAGTGSLAVDEFITFSNSDTASLGYPPTGSVTLQWIGRAYKIDGTSVTTQTTLPERTRSQLRMADGSQMMGILRATYTANGSLYRLRSVPEDITEALIFAIGSVT